jgi:ABC-type branched-subunit amino acid transport system substrate-binding protein
VVLATAGLLLATTACGARWNDDQQAAVLARHDGGDSSGDGSDEDADGAVGVLLPGGTTPGGATTGGGGSGATGAGSTGGTGGGDGGGGASGPAPCSAPSDAPGVSDTEITLGSISTQSGAVPGLGASSLAAVQAYIAYRNATGGVCGRQLALRSADDGMDNGRHRALTSELSSDVLGLVGGVGGGDAGSADVVEAEQLPVVNTPISEGFQDASTVFDINPPFADVNAVIGKYQYLYDQGVRTASVVYIAVDQTRSEGRDKHMPQMEAAGIQVVNQQEVPLSTLSFDSAARAVANSGADYLLFISDPGQSASMARAMADTGYEPMFEEYLTAYGSNYLELAGAGAEGTTSWIRSLPNEEPGTTPEQSAFLEWMDQVAPGVVADTFAADAWASTKAFVDALVALPGPITREALLAQLRSTTNFDAGGFIGPIQLGPKLNNGCVVGMIVEGGRWRRLAPAQGFLC